MKVQTKTLWNGLVGINERNLKNAVLDGEDLIVEFEGQRMHIPNTEVQARVHSESLEEFKDQYGKEPYRLLYFKWLPDEEGPVHNPLFK